MPDDCCPTMGTLWGHTGDGAFKTIEDTGLILVGNFKYFVVLIAAHIARCHGGTSNAGIEAIAYEEINSTSSPTLSSEIDRAISA